MLQRILVKSVAVGLLLSGAACNHCKNYKGRDCCPPSSSGGPSPYLGEPIPGRSGGGSTIPPTSVPTTPPSAMPGEALPPPVLPESRGSFSIDPRTPPGPWDPTPSAPSGRSDLPPAPAPSRSGKTELLAPDPLPGGAIPESSSSNKPNISNLLEEPVRSNGGTDLPPRPGTESTKPPATMPPSLQSTRLIDDPTTRAPVGLPGYARIPGYESVATGRKLGVEGFDWLRSNGFKSVVYLYAPASDIAPVRELATARGLRFIPIAISPATLQKAFDEFTNAITDRSNRPLYVIDEDGQRAGGLWYLLFRTQDLLGDDAARLRAAPLGLTEATTEEQKQFWIAVQEVLAKR